MDTKCVSEVLFLFYFIAFDEYWVLYSKCEDGLDIDANSRFYNILEKASLLYIRLTQPP